MRHLNSSNEGREMLSRFTSVCALLTFSISTPGVLNAHHALNAFFNLDSPVKIEGTLTSVRWVNPHISFEVQLTESSGESQLWRVESGSPILLRRAGVTTETFAVGDRVAITGYSSQLREHEMVGAVIHMRDGRDLPLFRSLAARLGYDSNASSGSHIPANVAATDEHSAQGIFRVWTSVAVPNAPRFEPEFRQSAIDARAAFDPLVDDPALSCTPRGMPGAMGSRFPIEFTERGNVIELRLELWGSTRTIHMADEAGSRSRQPSPLGYSVGRWEGNTLLVTTTDINWRYFDELGTPQTSALETEERFTLSEDARTLDYQITITDPGTLLEPAVRHARWAWVPGEEIQDYDCEAI